MDTSSLSVPADVGQAAEAFLAGEIAGTGTSQSDTQTSAPAQQATSTPAPTQTVTPAPTPASDTPTPLALDDSKTYLWTNPVTGTQEPKTGKEIKAGWMLQSDYTKKTQETAAQRKQAEAYLAEREWVVPTMTNSLQYLQWAKQNLPPEQVQALQHAIVAELTQQQPPQQPQIDPNQIATVADAQRYAQDIVARERATLQQQFAEAQRQLQQESQRLVQGLRDEIAVTGHNTKLEPAIKAVFEQHPILSAVPRAEDLIRFEVFQRTQGPTADLFTPEQAIQAFQETAARYASGLNAKFQELNKANVAAQQALVTNGIEPPGGALVQHQGPPKVPQLADGRVDFDAIAKNAEAFIRSQMAG